MKRALVLASLAGAIVLPTLMHPGTASASCADRKMTGTVLGGVGGALIGNSIARGGAGAVLGGLGGAFLGHEIAGSGCRHARYAYGPPPAVAPPPPQPSVYYDQYGDVIAPALPPGAPVGPAVPVAYAEGPACHTEMQSFYDSRGVLIRTPVRVCAR